MWPSLREFLRVPRELTGKNVRIAVIDGEFPHHPDISTNNRRTTYLVPGLSEPDAQPEVFEAEPGPWKGGWHALCAAAAAGGSGAESGGIYTGLAPEADLFLVAMYSRESEWDGETAHIKALEWVRVNWRKYEIRGVLSSRKSQIGSGVLPWQTDRRRILCEELVDQGLFVVSGSGNRPDETTAIAEAAAPSVLSVGGVAIPPDGDPNCARIYPGCRGTTFEGKWVPEILAPAQNVVLPQRNDEETENHYFGKMDDLPVRYARTNGTSFSGPALLGAAACVWQARPDWTAHEMKSALTASALKNRAWTDLRAGLVSVSDAVGGATPIAERGSVKSPFVVWSSWQRKSVENRLEILERANRDKVRDVILSFIGDDLPQRAAGAVRKHVNHPEVCIRAATVCALAGGKSSQVDSDFISTAFRDVSPVARMAGVYLLTRRSDLWPLCRDSLAALFDDPSLDVRIESVHLARKMASPDFVERIASGLEEDARMGRIANFAARRDALEAITGQQLPARPPFKFGQPSQGDARRVARVELALRWMDWLRVNWTVQRN
ncbi:MAG: S8 family serine peptidase [Gemmatimonadota bacterium]|nr:S8 family serine peptidase [Gemmatimonadota bacterium]